MSSIPKAHSQKMKRIVPSNLTVKENAKNVLFSFQAVERNEYFNLDGTCANWSADLFDTMKKVSNISIKDIYAGKYTGKSSPFRIHPHDKAKPPCKLPENISIEDMWQIRISLSKGGIHGVFADNVFYVVWFDPHHNLYPDKNHGGLKKVIPPSTCCKDREEEVARLREEIQFLREEVNIWEEIALEKDKSCVT